MHEVTTVVSPLHVHVEGTKSKGTYSVQSSTAAIDVTTENVATGDKGAEDGDSGALIGGIISGLLFFVALNVVITIIWERTRRRRVKLKAKQENNLSDSGYGDLHDDTAIQQPMIRNTGEQNERPDKRIIRLQVAPVTSGDLYRIDDEEYAEIGGRTPGAKNVYSLPQPTPDSPSVSSGERTPVHHIPETDGPQSLAYHVLESEISNRLDKKATGDEINMSLQTSGSGTQTPIYPCLYPENTSPTQNRSTS